MTSHIERMQEELVDLEFKLAKLRAFLVGKDNLAKMGEVQRILLVQQEDLMTAYSNVLRARIANDSAEVPN